MSTKPTATRELITPQWAVKVLEDHEDQITRGEIFQRPFSEATAQSYALAMQQGHWLLNDQGIMFDDQGRLRDGRHRLWAVVMAGVDVEMWVMRGCADKEVNGITIHVVDTVDIGRKRDVGQQLAIDGVGNSKKLATACRILARIACGFPSRKNCSVIQTRQILQIYGTQINRVVDGFRHSSRLCVSYLLAPVSMYRMFSSANADQFAEDLYSMSNLQPGSPVLALKRYLDNNGTASGSGQVDNHCRAVALALQHYEAGNSITTIRHSALGVEWLLAKQKNNVAQIRDIMGTKFVDHRKTSS